MTQPVRSSLLFSPFHTDPQSNTTSDQISSNSPPQSVSSHTSLSSQPMAYSHGQSLSISIPVSDQNIPDSQHKHHQRRRSEFRSKSTEHLTSNNIASINQSNPTLITASTTTTSVVSNGSKFTNLNVSQPTLRAAPMAPVQAIPATRFDTITSYVDVIYQQHQLQSSPQHHNSSSAPYYQASDDLENSNDGRTDQDKEASNGIVYLDPSDGIDGDKSFMATCPQCAMMVMTDIKPFPGKKSRNMACLFTPILLCWLPFNFSLGKKWMNVRHTCPKCQSDIAIYRK